jgi:hypothetical protein
MKMLAMLGAAVIGLLAVAGCGGEGDGGLPTGDVTRQEYIAAANDVCKEGDVQLNQAAETYFDQELGLKPTERPSLEQLVMFAEAEAIPVFQDIIDSLRDLEAPEADADQLTNAYDALQEDLDAAEEDPALLTRGEPFEESNRLLREYGLTACDD